MRKRKIITANAPPTTDRLPLALRLTGIALALAVALGARPACSTERLHVRGTILGTTYRSIDLATADHPDERLEMDPQPDVAIAEPGDANALHAGAFASIVATGRVAREVTLEPATVQIFRAGREPWDLGAAGRTIVNGIILRADGAASGRRSILVRTARAIARIGLPRSTPIVVLRPGSRAALVAGHAAFIFATPSTDGISDFVESIVVGDGALTLPF